MFFQPRLGAAGLSGCFWRPDVARGPPSTCSVPRTRAFLGESREVADMWAPAEPQGVEGCLLPAESLAQAGLQSAAALSEAVVQSARAEHPVLAAQVG